MRKQVEPQHIAIIGCGYIGMEAASIWNEKGFLITATTRKQARFKELSKVSQKSLIFKGDKEELVPLIAQNETLLVTIAADNSENYKIAYLQTAQHFRNLASELNMPRRLIYTGSTSIYGDHHGLWVDETSELRAKGEQAQILTETERTYLSLKEFGWSVCVLRFSEIYGPGRELSKKVERLQGCTLPGSGDHYTNMVHKKDCAYAIDYAFKHKLEGIFNISDDEHPTRRELYDAISRKFRLAKVNWDPKLPGLHSGNKRVSNHKIKAEGFSFFHPHRVLD